MTNQEKLQEAQPQERLQQSRADELIVTYCQGNLIRGYNMAFLRHLVVRVGDAVAARQFLLDVIDESSGAPQLTTEANWEQQAKPPMNVLPDDEDFDSDDEHDEQNAEYRRHASTVEAWDGKPATCLNVGISATGLKALGLNDESYMTFPEEFRQGAASRASKVGDVDGSDPKLWRDGFGDADMVHLMWTVHSGTEPNLNAACKDLEDQWQASGAFLITSRLCGEKLPDKETGRHGHDVHFGYRDDISQPRFQLHHRGKPEVVGAPDSQPKVELGALLQDATARTSFDEVKWQVPALVTPAGRNEDLSRYGCYNAFRVMEQDVRAFEDFLDSESETLGWNKEYLAAKLMGRWRNGVPMVFTPGHSVWSEPTASMPESRYGVGNDFDYAQNDVSMWDLSDLEGRACPLGSHIRRSNPRRGRIVQRSANHTRQIVRRGMPYGPPFDPDKPDDVERGLLGSFFCGSLLSQFESMMYDWINMGLQDPRITGTNCPIVGANKPESSRFDIPYQPDPENLDRVECATIRGFPRFVETVGAAYFFYPGVPGLRLLGRMK